MKRELFKQMRNSWRDNFLLVLALTIVLVAVWVISVQLWGQIGGLFQSRGFDPEDVYVIGLENISPESPDFIDYGEEATAMKTDDRKSIIRQIRSSSNVEYAAWSNNAVSYNMSWWGNMIYLDDGVDSIGYSGNFRYASPDMALVMRYVSHSGKSPEELANMLRKGELLVSNRYGEGIRSLGPEDMVGRRVYEHGDTTKKYRVADEIDFVKRTDYEIPFSGTVIVPVDDENPTNVSNIAIRVKPGAGRAFLDEYDRTPAMQRHRNLYVANLSKLTDMADTAHKEVSLEARMLVGVMLVFLLIILLGLLGIFWFRVQQRVQEIAIRKVCGASKTDIFRRILGEGMILLAFAFVLGCGIMWSAVKFGYIKGIAGVSTEVIVYTGLAALVLVAVGITLSLIWPASRAMRIEPAIAIKDE